MSSVKWFEKELKIQRELPASPNVQVPAKPKIEKKVFQKEKKKVGSWSEVVVSAISEDGVVEEKHDSSWVDMKTIRKDFSDRKAFWATQILFDSSVSIKAGSFRGYYKDRKQHHIPDLK
jgi:hypothetical protein